jgi:hypothetical protein
MERRQSTERRLAAARRQRDDRRRYAAFDLAPLLLTYITAPGRTAS